MTRTILARQPRGPHRRGGPGAHMRSRLKNLRVPACGECLQFAKQMDEWGPEECRRRRDEIIDTIWPRTKAFYDTLCVKQKAVLLSKWDATVAQKAGVLFAAIIDPDAALRGVLASLIDESIDAAQAESDLPMVLMGMSTVSGCCCFCPEGGCTGATGCTWSLPACPAPNGANTCICVQIVALDPACACLEGNYTIMNSIFSTHQWGYFSADDPCSDQTFFQILMDDSADMGGCASGCGSDKAYIRITCSAVDGEAPTNWCGLLCGDEEPLNMTGQMLACCGCIEVTVSEGAC